MRSEGSTRALVVGGHTHQQDDRVVGDGASSTPAASDCPTKATARHAGCGSPTASPSCADTAYDAARAGARMLEAGWPDERSIAAALIEPVEPIVVTRIFEGLAG